MADTITVKFKVLEDGSFQQIGADAEKAAKSTDKASKSSDHYSKKNKGAERILILYTGMSFGSRCAPELLKKYFDISNSL